MHTSYRALQKKAGLLRDQKNLDFALNQSREVLEAFVEKHSYRETQKKVMAMKAGDDHFVQKANAKASDLADFIEEHEHQKPMKINAKDYTRDQMIKMAKKITKNDVHLKLDMNRVTKKQLAVFLKEHGAGHEGGCGCEACSYRDLQRQAKGMKGHPRLNSTKCALCNFVHGKGGG